MRHLILLAPLAMFLAPAPAHAQAQLVDNFTQGLQRICVYSNLSRRSAENARRLRTGRALERVMLVGYGEPCPAVYRAPPTVDPINAIPSTARLTSDTVQNGRRSCTFTASTRSYSVPVPVSQRCPQSPLYLPRPSGETTLPGLAVR